MTGAVTTQNSKKASPDVTGIASQLDAGAQRIYRARMIEEIVVNAAAVDVGVDPEIIGDALIDHGYIRRTQGHYLLKK